MENNLYICKQCKQPVVRVESGEFASGKNKRYVDESDSLWNGRKCPGCHRLNVKLKTAESRQIRKLSNTVY